MIKFIIVKLNGSKESVVSEPIIIGIKYRIKRRLLKYFLIIY